MEIWGTGFELGELARLLLLFMGVSLVLGIALMGFALVRLRRLRLPADADFVEAMSVTPLMVVLVLDLLDFGLDFLSAPLAWVFLSKLGLRPLRGATVIESLIPGTQFIPTMTVAWLVVRFLGPRHTRHIIPLADEYSQPLEHNPRRRR